jgi:hypothetical protein
MYVGRKKYLTLLWLYVITGFLFDLLIILFNRVYHINSFPVGNLFLLTEFILISLLFRKHLYRNNFLFVIITAGLSLFFILTTYRSYQTDLNTFSASFFSSTYLVYSIVGLFIILREQKDIYLERSYLFWLCVAFLIYASGVLFIFLFKDYMRGVDDEFFKTLWKTFFRILNIIKNLTLAFAIYRKI